MALFVSNDISNMFISPDLMETEDRLTLYFDFHCPLALSFPFRQSDQVLL